MCCPFDASFGSQCGFGHRPGERHCLTSRCADYCVAKIGRTSRINDSVGRDHWPRADYVHGRTDRFGRERNAEPYDPEAISATIFDRLGTSPQTKLPRLGGGEVPFFPAGRRSGSCAADSRRPTDLKPSCYQPRNGPVPSRTPVVDGAIRINGTRRHASGIERLRE
jgi:Protein of unknown function (DUF1501)